MRSSSSSLNFLWKSGNIYNTSFFFLLKKTPKNIHNWSSILLIADAIVAHSMNRQFQFWCTSARKYDSLIWPIYTSAPSWFVYTDVVDSTFDNTYHSARLLVVYCLLVSYLDIHQSVLNCSRYCIFEQFCLLKIMPYIKER